MRALTLCCAAILAAQSLDLRAQEGPQPPLLFLDVPFISQSELLCGGAAAAMVLRYWGERGVSAESFVGLVDRSASGIRTDVLVDELVRRGWDVAAFTGNAQTLTDALESGSPALALIEDRPGFFHYIVVVAAHERGVVFHDPARVPFMVMSAAEFDRRWRSADRWMARIAPGRLAPETERAGEDSTSDAPASLYLRPTSRPSLLPCDELIAYGVQLAEKNDLEGAEQVFSARIGCPAAMRELAGVRVLQKRWGEASDLAAAAVEVDAGDTYAWKVLATSRFVQNDRLGALAAWNRVDEPRLDLVQFDGLTRTRHRAVERLVHVPAGGLLSPGKFTRAGRRLAELPSATSTRLEYRPLPAGLVELRGVVSERPLVPKGPFAVAAIGVSALATREVRVTTGSLTGGGEKIQAAWRFWPRRPRLAVGVVAPAPWGGVWGAHAYTERQGFSVPTIRSAERTGGRLELSDWLTGRWRWTVSAGVDEWSPAGARGAAGVLLQFASVDGRVGARVAADAWPGSGGFTTSQISLHAQSSTTLQGLMLVADGGLETASRETPLDMWWAGDTGHARAALLRAHPVLDDGHLLVDRLGRTFLHGSIEVQHWWRVAGPLRAAAAGFVDLGNTRRRASGAALSDADVGIGVRIAVAGIPGTFHTDIAKGLRDRASAISIRYKP